MTNDKSHIKRYQAISTTRATTKSRNKTAHHSTTPIVHIVRSFSFSGHSPLPRSSDSTLSHSADSTSLASNLTSPPIHRSSDPQIAYANRLSARSSPSDAIAVAQKIQKAYVVIYLTHSHLATQIHTLNPNMTIANARNSPPNRRFMQKMTFQKKSEKNEKMYCSNSIWVLKRLFAF